MLHVIDEALRGWRDDKYKVRHLAPVIERHRLPGVALVVNYKKDWFEVPPPIEVPFEPLELDEANPALRTLFAAYGEVTKTAVQMPRRRPWRRHVVRWGIPLALVGALLPQAVHLTLLPMGNRAVAYWLWAALAAVVVGALTARWLASSQWLLVPRGLVIRRAVIGRVGVSLQLYTPADTYLSISPQQRKWIAELWRDRCKARKQITAYEAAALLAAWQSPLPPPEEEKLGDLA